MSLKQDARVMDHVLAELPRVSMPVDTADEERFPEIAAAHKWYQSLPAERRAEWEQ